MTMKELAERYRLRKVFTGVEWVIPGKYGEIADMSTKQYPDDFRLRILAVPRSADMDRILRSRRKMARAAGLQAKVWAHAEAIFFLDPHNSRQVEAAIRIVGTRKRRKLSAEQAALASSRLAAWRKGTVPAGPGDATP